MLLIGILEKVFHRTSETRPITVTISNSFIRGMARLSAGALAIILLLAPIILLNAVVKTLLRFVILFVAATLFVFAITITSQASMTEIFAAGAAYTAVLVVFVSGNGVSGTSTPGGS